MKSSAVLSAPIALIFAFPVIGSTSYAQSATENISPEIIETLVVSGSQSQTDQLTNQLITVNSTDLMAGARLDPSELFLAVPGVQVDSRTNYAQDTRISLRGFGARSAFGVRGIDLLVDGVPMSTPDGQGQLSSVMLDTLASVSVLRGPLAALYGNSSGGVIALQTLEPEHTQLRMINATGEQGLARYQVQGDYRQDRFAVRGQYADTQVTGERPHSRAERQQSALQAYYSGDIDFSIKHEQSYDPLLQDPLGLTPTQWQTNPWQENPLAETFNTRKRVSHRQTSVRLREQEGHTRWQAAAWQGERDITQYLGFSGEAISGSGGVVDLARDFAGASATISQSVRWLSMPLDLSIGGESAQMEDRRRGYVNNQGVAGDLRRDELGEVISQDIFSVIECKPVPNFSLYTGARRTWLNVDVEDYFIQPGNPDDSGAKNYSERAWVTGASYMVADRWELFVSRGRGYETPTLTEMAYTANNGSAHQSGLNTQLQAAINHQQQGGLTYRVPERLQVSIIHFTIDTANELVVDQSMGGRTSFRNAAQTERAGVELFARWRLDAAWHLQASAQSMTADYSAGQWSGKQLPGVARAQYQFGVEWRPLHNEHLQVNLLGQQRSRIFTADSNQVAAPGFYTIDVSLQGEWFVFASPWLFNWWLKLANLSDENYVGSVVVNQSNGRSFEPALGRNISAGATLTYRF